MKIDDPEVTKLHEAAVAAQKVADDFWNSIDKKDVPLSLAANSKSGGGRLGQASELGGAERGKVKLETRKQKLEIRN